MLKITVEAKIKSGEQVSGDTFVSFDFKGGAVFILCDGMGSGDAARAQSEFAAAELMRLIKNGTAPDSAAVSVSLAICESEKSEIFSTADILIISDDRNATLVKAGAAPTLLLGSKTHVFECAALPLGIIPCIKPDVAHFSVSRGDRIVMLSDGCLCDTSLNMLCEAIQNGEDTSPLFGEKYGDDITLIQIEVA